VNSARSGGLSRLHISLAALCLGLLVAIGVELVGGEPPADPAALAARPPERADAGAPPGFTMLPTSAFAAVLARPLFSRTRRPGAQAGPLPLSSSFTLVAIVISAGGRHALLGSGQPLKVIRVKEGEEIGGWTVETILPNAVVVRHADLREEVKPKNSNHSVTTKLPSTADVISNSRQEAVQAAPKRRAHDE
jgi:hypothetical protein